jgi:hypothetical protein
LISIVLLYSFQFRNLDDLPHLDLRISRQSVILLHIVLLVGADVYTANAKEGLSFLYDNLLGGAHDAIAAQSGFGLCNGCRLSLYFSALGFGYGSSFGFGYGSRCRLYYGNRLLFHYRLRFHLLYGLHVFRLDRQVDVGTVGLWHIERIMNHDNVADLLVLAELIARETGEAHQNQHAKDGCQPAAPLLRTLFVFLLYNRFFLYYWSFGLDSKSGLFYNGSNGLFYNRSRFRLNNGSRFRLNNRSGFRLNNRSGFRLNNRSRFRLYNRSGFGLYNRSGFGLYNRSGFGLYNGNLVSYNGSCGFGSNRLSFNNFLLRLLRRIDVGEIHAIVEHDGLKLREGLVDQLLHGVVRNERHLRVTVDDHTLASSHADAFAGFDVDNLERSQTLDFHRLVFLQVLQDDGKEL